MAPQCALCQSPASVFCRQDGAYLCGSCDTLSHPSSNPLAMRHAEESFVAQASAPQETSAGSAASLDLLLGLGPAADADAAVPSLVDNGTHADLMTSLLSFDDALPSFDFGLDMDLTDLLEPEGPDGCSPQQADPAAVMPAMMWDATPADTSLSLSPTSSTFSAELDAVVPVLGGTPRSDMCSLSLLPSEPSSPLSPRLVTTGAYASGGFNKQEQLPFGKAAVQAPVQTSGLATAVVPTWVSSAASIKPESVTTNMAGSMGLSKKRDAAALHLAGAPRATAKLARAAAAAVDNTAGLAGFVPSMPATAAAAAPAATAMTTRAGTVIGAPPVEAVEVAEVPSVAAAAAAAATVPGGAVPYHVTTGYVDTETRADKLARYRAKKARRTFHKTIRYQTRKDYAEVRPRIKGRFVSPEEYAAWKAEQEGATAMGGDHVVPTVKAR